MLDPLIAKLEGLAVLTDPERQAITEALTRSRALPAGSDIAVEGRAPEACTVLLDGWAARYKLLDDGKRQITGFLIAGDLCDLDGLLAGFMDHSVTALTQVTVAPIPRDLLMRLMERHPGIANAIQQDLLSEAAIAREWVLNVGRRSAYQRIAHVLCEMALRLERAGLARRSEFRFPVRQADLADATGLTTVHVNRTIQAMRGDGLVTWSGSNVVIPDWERLQQAGAFRPGYLRLDRGSRNSDDESYHVK
ncbi:MAG TPA: Crp/Fnr family transcriptional regulator [Microvirga sp.]|jgi:CRP-like cAMP-binding protein|nr:Crp/Fnr family transcriptional regulator [Microvirga sp.]